MKADKNAGRYIPIVFLLCSWGYLLGVAKSLYRPHAAHTEAGSVYARGPLTESRDPQL